MAKGDPCDRRISSIVDYILNRHKVKVSWRLVSLEDGEWSKVMWERSALDKTSRNISEQICKLLDDPTNREDIDLPTLFKLREAIQLAKQDLAEYDTVPSYFDYLAADAMVMPVNEVLTLSEKMPHLQPFTLEMAKANCHVDFLIIINSSRFSDVSDDEKLTVLAHEAVHIIESVRNSQKSSFESIETKVKKLVSDFRKRAKK